MSTTSLLGDHERVKDDIEEGLAAQVSGSRSSAGPRYRKPTLHLATACMILLVVMSGLRSVTPPVFLKPFYGGSGPCFRKGMGGLPTHYILPSGDKIPSVALGKYRLRRSLNF